MISIKEKVNGKMIPPEEEKQKSVNCRCGGNRDFRGGIHSSSSTVSTSMVSGVNRTVMVPRVAVFR